MKTLKTRFVFALTTIAAIGFVPGSSLASAADEPAGDAGGYQAWKPKEMDRAAYRDIVDYNIFRADRKTLADAVDDKRNPQPPTQRPTRTEPVRAEDPPHPDSFWRLNGITHDEQGPAAYLEDTKNNKLTVLRGPAEVSLGKVTSIGYEKIMYVVDDEKRLIEVGQTLLGTRMQLAESPPRSSSSGSSGSSGSTSSEAGRAAALQALRERRARELEGAAPQQPAEGEKPQAGTEPDKDTTTTPRDDTNARRDNTAAPADNAENTADPDPDNNDDPINRVLGSDSRDGDNNDNTQAQP